MKYMYIYIYLAGKCNLYNTVFYNNLLFYDANWQKKKKTRNQVPRQTKSDD